MKVLWFCNTPANGVEFLKGATVGGGWLQGLDIAIQNDVELHVAFFNPNGPSTFKHKRTTYYSIQTKNWRKKLIFKSLFNINIDKHEPTQYLKIIQNVQPDIIHIHGTEEGFLSILPIINIPILVSIQGILTVINHKYDIGIKKEILKSTSFESGGRISSVLPKSYWFLKKGLSKRSDRENYFMQYIKHVAGRTSWDKRVTSILSPKATYYQIDRVLKESFYVNTWTEPNHSKLMVYTTSSTNTFKGLETICEAVSELQKIYPDMEWNVAGVSKDDSIVNAVKAQLGAKFPHQGLNLLGKLSEVEIVDEMKKAHVYVMASHIENSPNNLAEAMMLGMPCVATLAGGTLSYLNDDCGIVIQDGDPWAMAGSVLELFRNRSLAAKLGQNARKVALQRHDKNKVIKQLMSTYSSLYRKVI